MVARVGQGGVGSGGREHRLRPGTEERWVREAGGWPSRLRRSVALLHGETLAAKFSRLGVRAGAHRSGLGLSGSRLVLAPRIQRIVHRRLQLDLALVVGAVQTGEAESDGLQAASLRCRVDV
jgi:hypothetical protein